MNIIRSTFTWKSASEKNAKNKLGAGDGGGKNPERMWQIEGKYLGSK